MFYLILFLVLDFVLLLFALVTYLDKKHEKEKENLRKLERNEKVKRVCKRLANTLNRLDNFLDKWQEVCDEEDK